MSIINYKIPDNILEKIPDYFWPALAGELVSVFSPSVFDKEDTDVYQLDFVCGTAGFDRAFHMTCRKLDLMWLYDYRNRLEWYDYDMFDSEISDSLINNVLLSEPKKHSSYYDWLNTDRHMYDVAYICDEKACESCRKDNNRYCYHTTDIRHAKNFEEVEPGKFIEKIVDDFGIGRYS